MALKEVDCVNALKTGVTAQLASDGLAAAYRVFCADDEIGQVDEDREYPAIEIIWSPYVPIGWQTIADHTIPMTVRCITHHSDDQKGVNCAAIYESVRECLDSYDFESSFQVLTGGVVLITGGDSGIEGMTRYIELELEWRVCG